MAWTYDKGSHTYTDAEGAPLTISEMRALRDDFTALRQESARGLSADLAGGKIDLPTWEQGMRGEVKTSFVDLAALGRGGRDMMTQADWGRVGSDVKSQYGFLSDFSRQIAGGELSEAQISARAAMYPGAATSAYERARATSYGVELPGMPGEDVQCGANCRCSWDLVETEEGVEATWIAADDEGTCEDCARNAEAWAPYVGEEQARGNGRLAAHA